MKTRGQTVYSHAERIERLSIPEPNSGCWLWLGGDDGRRGYGRLCVGSRQDGTRRMRQAHVISYETFKGPVPPGQEVCHHCDNPPCVNPDHLFAGTRQDNVDDRERKGRNSPPPNYRGADAPWAKLTTEQVAEIRQSKISSRLIAPVYGLSDGQIRAVRRGEYYRPAPPPSSTAGGGE